MSVQVTIYPPAPQTVFLDDHQFSYRPSNAVSAKYMGADTWESPGVSFGDYNSMQTTHRKSFKSRRFKTPAWANNDLAVQSVIVSYLENRVFSLKRRLAMSSRPQPSLKERLHRAEDALRARVLGQGRVLDRLCAEYCDLKNNDGDSARIASLDSEIRGLDCQIIINRSPAKVLASIIYGYYREGKDSVAVGCAVGLYPATVRQILFRLWETARQLGFPPPARSQQRKDASEENRPHLLAARRAARLRLEMERRVARTVRKAQRDKERAEREAAAHIKKTTPPKGPTRVRWRREGKCVGCGKEKSPSFVYCASCRERQRAYMAASKVQGVTAP